MPDTNKLSEALDTGIQQIGSGADVLGNAAIDTYKNLDHHVRTAIEDWHNDPKRVLESVPEGAKDMVREITQSLHARTIASAERRTAQVAQDQEVTKVSSQMMKEGKFKEANDLISRHVRDRMLEEYESSPSGQAGQLALQGVKGAVHTLINPTVDAVKDAVNRGEYGEAAAHLLKDITPWLFGVGEGKIAEEGVAKLAPELEQGLKAAAETPAATTAVEEAGRLNNAPVSPATAPKPGMIRPGYQTVPGVNEPIPVRAQGPVAQAAEAVMPNSGKAGLQEFEATQTQPAVRRGVAQIAQDATKIENAASAATKEDALGFGGTMQALQNRARPTFQAIDEATNGEFSAAQKEADIARSSMDFEGKKALQTALKKQEDLLTYARWKENPAVLDNPKLATSLSEDALAQAKDDWKKSIGMDDLKSRFDKVVHPAPANVVEKLGYDPGVLKASPFRESLLDALQKGEFSKAGFAPEHVKALEDLGVLLEKQQVKFNDVWTNLAKHIVPGAAGLFGGGPVGAAAGAGAEWLAGKGLSKLMTSLPSLEVVNAGLKSGIAAETIASRLADLWHGESGEMKVPFTGGAGAAPKEESGLSGAIKGVAQFGDDAAAALADARKPGLKADYAYNPNATQTGGLEHSVTTRDAEGNKIGDLSAQETGNIKQREVTEIFSQVYDKADRGQGIGKAQIQTMIHNLSQDPAIKYFHSDISTSEDARNVWRSLEKKYPDVITSRTVGKGKDAKPIWTVDLDKVRESNPTGGISHDELAQHHNENGGFTHLSDEDVAVGKRYPVAGEYPKATQEFPSEKITPAQVKAYAEHPDVKTALADHPDNRIGGWASDGKSYLEVSRLHSDLDEAKSLAQKLNQKAIFDLQEGKEIPTGGAGTLNAGNPVSTPTPAPAQPLAEGEPVRLPAPEERTPGQRISQRVPTAVKSTEDAVNGNLIIGRDAINKAEAAAPGYKSKLAQRVADYPGVKITPEEAMANPDKALTKFTKHIADNLVWLHNQIPENIRSISKLWYDSAHELTKQWASQYGLKHEQMAGIVAALSPQNEWNNNVGISL